VRTSGCLGWLKFDEAIDEFWTTLEGGAPSKGILRVAAQRHLARHVAGRRDQPRRDGRHRVGEGPTRCRGHKNEALHPLWVVNRQLLSHHAAQAHPHHVGPADTCAIEHGDDITRHIGDAKRTCRQALYPLPRLSTSTSRKCRRSFRSTGSHPKRSKPMPWIRTSHGRRRCSVPRNS
jgi:hypothetical protein